MKHFKIAVDLGNGFVKAKTSSMELVAPSSIVLKENIPDNQFNKSHPDYDIFETEGASFVWGKALEDPHFIMHPDDLISTYIKGSTTRYHSEPYKNLFRAVIAKLITMETRELEPVINIHLVTGLPSQDRNEANKKTIEQFLLNRTNIVLVNDKEVKFQVTKLAIIEQPLGILLNEAIDQNGIADANILDGNSGVLDFGAGTVLIDFFFKGNRVDSKSKSIETGMKDLYETVLDRIDHNRSFNVSDIETVLRTEKDIELSRLSLSYQDVKRVFDEEVEKFISYKICQDLEKFIGSNHRTNVYLAGGGVPLVRFMLKKNTSFAGLLTEVKDTQLASVRGMIKFNEQFLKDDEDETV